METYNSLKESSVYADDDSGVIYVTGVSIEVIGGLGSLALAQPKWIQCLRILFCL